MIFNKMLGKVMSKVESPTNETLVFTEKNTGVQHLFYHKQDCCE